MFSGIVEEIGTIISLSENKITVRADTVIDGTNTGDSININGTCLTAVSLDDSSFSVEVTPETLRRTNLGELTLGDSVNLERALKVGDRIGGHMVQGHIEATGSVLSVEPEEDSLLISFGAPEDLMRYVVAKGFIAVDGVSLTIVECDSSSFKVSVIPYTRDHTVIRCVQTGAKVNLETDVIARYVERLVNYETSPNNSRT
ncbi:MAG: riboflavin synthase [Chloroflexi bacterium]|nr:MAG: riboflavin synthase [Chloroflexota bacterium]